MIHALKNQFGEALLDRSTLWVNHLLTSEPIAGQRLQKHVGRTIEGHLANWPGPLPQVSPILFRITPAGLLERDAAGAATEPDLRVTIEASNPALAAARAVGGSRPRIDIAGDAAFAADLNWLIDNLRWDVEDDLARVLGPVPAREIARVGGGIANGLRGAARALGGLVARR